MSESSVFTKLGTVAPDEKWVDVTDQKRPGPSDDAYYGISRLSDGQGNYTPAGSTGGEPARPGSAAAGVSDEAGSADSAGEQVNFYQQRLPLRRAGFFLAVKDAGSCSTIQRIQITYLACSELRQYFILYPRTVTGRQVYDIRTVEGRCLPGASLRAGAKAPQRICQANGHWNSRNSPGLEPPRGEEAGGRRQAASRRVEARRHATDLRAGEGGEREAGRTVAEAKVGKGAGIAPRHEPGHDEALACQCLPGYGSLRDARGIGVACQGENRKS
ncbi:unnamed protein product [Protopolystoma xenopodis]|uniref:Uncharacterized protein n=1 Tax=Protopolystoma xenopodis TaxID=117903 RepID=A0A3S5AML8_9PLAT|nr:unnamed protein product [Protopolystoma xenopodis]